MYTYLEKELVIPSKNIIIIIDYIHLKKNCNTEFYANEIKNKKIINLAPKEEKSVIITDNEIYFTSYALSTLMSRSNEYLRISGGSNSNE
ncbi:MULTISPECIES: extracellular matrix regulator RemB [Fusobacterium]|jgi:hypothetical protein|uniref:DUF370 domain-containing protein n=1 Tax=Fusobacterium varium ATCC 27725 TaxID=469618 RepID=A0ABM6U2L5_FUSVA|nr:MULTISPECIES: extracellular matrix/biofilm biosynthesis regulator RemA family protein [Fusobacterium]AVQ30568.1 DUF370 domain-containing protein [Fusobacterium varium ATCC 27725]EES63994.1 hypothetical protein FVAG_02462 [Fusobacterium varium ATCC 27725]MCD7979313.1 DUF370 domain-containing protein [Fusobacterium sp.]MCF0172010.1 DUF370 domain-containing protein [Fusobacterium varium]MCF2672799.1 DUF370 domain-containing protein [Fusobacterium varium]